MKTSLFREGITRMCADGSRRISVVVRRDARSIDFRGPRTIPTSSFLIVSLQYDFSIAPRTRFVVPNEAAKQKAGVKKAPKRAAPAAVDPLQAAVAFAESVGGFDKAKAAIERIDQIKEL